MPRQTTSTTRRVDRTRVELVLQELLDRRIERDQDIGQYPTTRPHEVDAEESDTPIMDPFREFGGASAIAEMTNFTQREFNELWLTVRDYVVANYGVGRGKR
ncbi:hypothetical protein DVH05_021822 [Phytophthora capsici]|nr:hypothetical protein DVH05_021822 [Phytophthora capsici]